MEYLLIAAIIAIISMIVKFIFGANIKKLKKISENNKLDEIIQKYPSNIEICKTILKKLKNEKVKIKEVDQESSMYIAIGNSINIGKIQKTFTRIQTIAHECLHSIQNRRILVFNVIISNIFLLYFVIIVILRFLKIEFVVSNQSIFFAILIGLGFAYYAIRTYLENDAMIKAKYLAKEYMEEQTLSSKEEINEIIEEYDKLNDIGIRCVNYNIFIITAVFIVIFSLICFIR
ncbi:MAG: hypothetical protein RSC92_04695 [Clostridia bacterium]